MAKEITCKRCGETRAPLSGHVPFKAALKQEVEGSICQQCWSEWLDEQVRLINELALNLGDSRSHEIIEQKARDFLGFGDGPGESSTGTPPEQQSDSVH